MAKVLGVGGVFFKCKDPERLYAWTGLIASPSGQETARFKMTAIGPLEVVFENPEHDFPQRIAYRLIEDGKLLGRIEGTVNGEAKAGDFAMTRTACDDVDEKFRRQD